MAQLTIDQAFHLAHDHHQAGRLTDAENIYRQILAQHPNHAEAYFKLGNLLKDTRRFDEVIAAYRKAISLRSNYPDAWNNLGNALIAQGKTDEAIAAYRQAITFIPSYAQAWCNLGSALTAKGDRDGAIESLWRATTADPGYADAFNNLGYLLTLAGKPDEAITACQQAITIKPHFPEAFSNLGNAFKDCGQLDQAIAAYRKAITQQPNYVEADDNLVYAIQFHPGYNAQQIAEEHRRWNRRHAEPLQQFFAEHVNNRDPDRRLRIGYVSGDFRDHVVGRNLLPLFEQHDRSRFEIICYSQLARPDATTARFQKHADRWRNISTLNDAAVADLIRKDSIDILVDLTLHMARNRLLVFARKPAPVQVTFAGYPGTTGLTAIDYRLSDPHLDPLDVDESIYSEKSIRLPHSFWCYQPTDDEKNISRNELPAKTNGFVTFGCLNNFCKFNDEVLRLWAKALMSVPSSRLLMLVPKTIQRTHILERFAQEGVASERIEMIAPQPRRKYLELYHRIDIGLDTFPYNGHTTSLDSLWMGAPVITLVGQTVVGRAGLSQLMNLELLELIASTPEHFVQIATEWAIDLPRLDSLRATLRTRMEQSPLMDAKKFASDIEAAYQQMWRTWTAK